MKTAADESGNSLAIASAKRAFTARYSDQSSDRNTGTHVRDVTGRPQPFVREPAVVAPLFLRRQPDALERVGRRVGRHSNAIARVDDVAIGAAGAVSDPRAAALAHQRIERHRHAAGRRGRSESFRRADGSACRAHDSRRRPGGALPDNSDTRTRYST